RRVSKMIAGPRSPPGPLRCGSTTCKGKAGAMPASKALPPFSKGALPTAGPSHGGDGATPQGPSVSGRGGEKPRGGVCHGDAAVKRGRHFTTGRPGGQPLVSARVPGVELAELEDGWRESKRLSGRARIRGRSLAVVRRAGGLVAEHHAPSLDLARRLVHLSAQ